jgi:hypothetical protein
MNSPLFRKTALDRLASPEDLDQVLVEPAPRGSLLLAVVLALLGAAALWGWFGSLPVVVHADGALVQDGSQFRGLGALIYSRPSEGYKVRVGDTGSIALATMGGGATARLPVTVSAVSPRPITLARASGMWIPIRLNVGSKWIASHPGDESGVMMDGVPVKAVLTLGTDRPLAYLIPSLTQRDGR